MNSQKLLRNMLEAAMSADLEKNEMRALMALLNQTIGYGKRSDPLTMGRIAKLTGIRKDRVGKALTGLVDKGIFERTPHKWLDYTYTIPAKFFGGETESRFFAPSVPVNGEAPQPRETETHSAVTYRDTPLQNSTHTETNTPEAVPAPVNPIETTPAVCAVSESSVIEKPEAVDAEAYRRLLPSLQALPGEQSNQVLQLVALAVTEGSIRTTQERMGGGLIKAARAGTLDTSRLQVQEKMEKKRLNDIARERQWEARQRASEAQHLAMLEMLSNRIDSEKTGVRK